MSGPGAYPPPGSDPPQPAGWGAPPGWAPPPPPAWGTPPPAGWAPPPAYRPAHKPGVIPLRPLTLGDFYDAAFKMMRANPGATVGSAALVAAVSGLVPIVLLALVSGLVDLEGLTSGTDQDPLSGISTTMNVTSLGTTLIQFVGLIFVTGMVAHVAMAAAVGRKLTMGNAWALTRGKRWRLVGLTLLLFTGAVLVSALYVLAWVVVVLTGEVVAMVVWGILSVPAFLCLMVWLYVRVYYLAVPPLMLEDVGVLGAIRRGYALTRGQFWRTLGIALLTALVTGLASSVLTVPLTIVALIIPFLVEGVAGIFLMILLQALGTMLATAFVAPFSAGVVSLQYVDQRMRKEAFDVELLTRAGLAPS